MSKSKPVSDGENCSPDLTLAEQFPEIAKWVSENGPLTEAAIKSGPPKIAVEVADLILVSRLADLCEVAQVPMPVVIDWQWQLETEWSNRMGRKVALARARRLQQLEGLYAEAMATLKAAKSPKDRNDSVLKASGVVDKMAKLEGSYAPTRTETSVVNTRLEVQIKRIEFALQEQLQIATTDEARRAILDVQTKLVSGLIADEQASETGTVRDLPGQGSGWAASVDQDIS